MWNFEYGGWMGIWFGPGEAEVLGEFFFDNLATLLSVTDLMLGFFLNVLIKLAAVSSPGTERLPPARQRPSSPSPTPDTHTKRFCSKNSRPSTPRPSSRATRRSTTSGASRARRLRSSLATFTTRIWPAVWRRRRAAWT
jgi:hypothetical protein